MWRTSSLQSLGFHFRDCRGFSDRELQILCLLDNVNVSDRQLLAIGPATSYYDHYFF